MPQSAYCNAPNLISANEMFTWYPKQETNTKKVQHEGTFVSGFVKDIYTSVWEEIEVGHILQINCISFILIEEGNKFTKCKQISENKSKVQFHVQ